MLTFHDFLLKNKKEILALTESKTKVLAGTRASSEQLKQGLPIFFKQFLEILQLGRPALSKSAASNSGVAKGAEDADETAIAVAANKPEEVALAESAARHGVEMLRLGYTLSHVVHAYGDICQSITELANIKSFPVDIQSFHDLNQCLDVAIAGAVTEYQKTHTFQERNREVQHLGSLTHELRNALASATISFQIIKKGTVGVAGRTGEVLENSLKRLEKLIDQSLTDVRFKVDPILEKEPINLLGLVDQILVSAEIEALTKKQKISVKIDPAVIVEADQQAIHSALSNLIQNAIKFTRKGGLIQVRGKVDGGNVVIEVEDECGGLADQSCSDLFTAFTQTNKNRSGLGLGLTIAQKAVHLNHGNIRIQNLAGKGCIFKVTLPTMAERNPNHSVSH